MDAMAELVERLGHDGRIRYRRDREYLDWRFRNPTSEYRFLYWEESRLEGYLVLSRRVSDLGAWYRVYIADLEATDHEDTFSAAVRRDELGAISGTRDLDRFALGRGNPAAGEPRVRPGGPGGHEPAVAPASWCARSGMICPARMGAGYPRSSRYQELGYPGTLFNAGMRFASPPRLVRRRRQDVETTMRNADQPDPDRGRPVAGHRPRGQRPPTLRGGRPFPGPRRDSAHRREDHDRHPGVLFALPATNRRRGADGRGTSAVPGVPRTGEAASFSRFTTSIFAWFPCTPSRCRNGSFSRYRRGRS